MCAREGRFQCNLFQPHGRGLVNIRKLVHAIVKHLFIFSVCQCNTRLFVWTQFKQRLWNSPVILLFWLCCQVSSTKTSLKVQCPSTTTSIPLHTHTHIHTHTHHTHTKKKHISEPSQSNKTKRWRFWPAWHSAQRARTGDTAPASSSSPSSTQWLGFLVATTGPAWLWADNKKGKRLCYTCCCAQPNPPARLRAVHPASCVLIQQSRNWWP